MFVGRSEYASYGRRPLPVALAQPPLGRRILTVAVNVLQYHDGDFDGDYGDDDDYDGARARVFVSCSTTTTTLRTDGRTIEVSSLRGRTRDGRKRLTERR